VEFAVICQLGIQVEVSGLLEDGWLLCVKLIPRDCWMSCIYYTNKYILFDFKAQFRTFNP